MSFFSHAATYNKTITQLRNMIQMTEIKMYFVPILMAFGISIFS